MYPEDLVLNVMGGDFALNLEVGKNEKDEHTPRKG